MAQITLKLKPFTTPNYVVSDTFEEIGLTSFPLKDVDADTLSAMCDAFREEIFRKAEKQDPRLK